MKVAVGLSGGVDSTVSAYLLKQRGYDVTGVFMKNWATDLPGFKCPWRSEMLDAKRVAVRLGIPFKIYDFTSEYKQLVVDVMLDSYRAGNNPNPDVLCNQSIKFDLFMRAAEADGFNMVATGHYARIARDDSRPKSQDWQLLQGVDQSKDQSYFLYRMPRAALAKTIFPLGGSLKSDVRALAEKLGFSNHAKKDSVGICFVGDIDINDFLGHFIDEKPGVIIDQTGNRLGSHKGLHLYTLGQRHGLNLDGPRPHYVVAKDVDTNQLIVSDQINDDAMWRNQFGLLDQRWLIDIDELRDVDDLTVRLRHLGELLAVDRLETNDQGQPTTFTLRDPVKSISPGQSAVFYHQDRCLGGGILS